MRDIMMPEAKNKSRFFNEEKRIMKKDCLIFEPDAWFKKMWGVVLIISLAYTATLMPYRIAFFSDDTTSILYFIDTSLDFVFLFDMLINFNSPIMSNNVVVTYSRKEIVIKYLKTWFFIDIFSSVPINIILMNLSTSNNSLRKNNLIKVARLPKLYKLLRITRLLKIVKVFKSSIFI